MWKYWRDIFKWLFPLYCSGCAREDCTICQECVLKLTAAKNCVEVDFMAAFEYEKRGILAKALHLFKYDGIIEYGFTLGYLLAEKLSYQSADIITWPPMHPKKQAQRGFNQSQILAINFSGIKAEVLLKNRNTKPQATLNKIDRGKNLLNVFNIKDEWKQKIIGKKILIIDDVATTLATIREMTKVLKEAGASEVRAAVLARQ